MKLPRLIDNWKLLALYTIATTTHHSQKTTLKMNPITPFQIAVPDSHLQSLHQKLSLASFPDELDSADWDMGCPLSEMKRLTAYWKDGFDWREKEHKLNEQLPQFTTSVAVSDFGELDIHFVHQRSITPGAIPLLFIHGCKCCR